MKGDPAVSKRLSATTRREPRADVCANRVLIRCSRRRNHLNGRIGRKRMRRRWRVARCSPHSRRGAGVAVARRLRRCRLRIRGAGRSRLAARCEYDCCTEHHQETEVHCLGQRCGSSGHGHVIAPGTIVQAKRPCSSPADHRFAVAPRLQTAESSFGFMTVHSEERVRLQARRDVRIDNRRWPRLVDIGRPAD